mmetsp:Transcript_2194/g.6537  ORF Transcript_2194/g.6537 Transcript_2194/m.6537 type:complete len:231 (+) Transcript_2194:306-998(+)
MTSSFRTAGEASCKSLLCLGSTKLSSAAQRYSAGAAHSPATLRGSTSYKSKPAAFLTDPRTHRSAAIVATVGTCAAPRRTTSSESVRRELKAESRTSAATSGSRVAAYSSAVTAPMDRPQRATGPRPPRARSRRRTHATSSCSCWPSDTYSPSDMPEPAQSMATTWKPRRRPSASCERPSTRELALPWAYTRVLRGAGSSFATFRAAVGLETDLRDAVQALAASARRQTE